LNIIMNGMLLGERYTCQNTLNGRQPAEDVGKGEKKAHHDKPEEEKKEKGGKWRMFSAITFAGKFLLLTNSAQPWREEKKKKKEKRGGRALKCRIPANRIMR